MYSWLCILSRNQKEVFLALKAIAGSMIKPSHCLWYISESRICLLFCIFLETVQTALSFNTAGTVGSFLYFITCRNGLLEEETNLFKMTKWYIRITDTWPWLGKLNLWIAFCHLVNFWFRFFFFFPSSSAQIILLVWFTDCLHLTPNPSTLTISFSFIWAEASVGAPRSPVSSIIVITAKAC